MVGYPAQMQSEIRKLRKLMLREFGHISFICKITEFCGDIANFVFVKYLKC